ncbi:hypothetical protein [Pelagibacterium limicola]|uniref:hypothetical protein n=1 Tax=Pelagibacterium limicola TaxID=2791022 RepID=UPI0018AFD190|nr:hypothetical protein [Pelagibacterium limicola]
MSVREKQAWFALVTTFLLWPYYFATLFAAVASRDIDGWALLTVFVWTLVIHIALLLGLAIVSARMAREDFDAPPDELERIIEARADKVCRRVLELGIAVVAIASFWVSEVARGEFAADPAGATAILMANALMVVGMAAGLIRETILIGHFRTTAAA